jgi:hypothetical protein
LEDGREIYGYVRGFQSSFLPQVEAMQEANRATRQKFAEDIQDTAALGGLGNRNIQGPIQPLAIDFDETLALGTKMLDENGKEDLPAYSDRKKVMESLAQARPTSLAKRLASIEQKNPGYVRMFSRILTARPQSTADIIASTLNRFGLPYLEQDVTGVSQGLGTDIAKAKAANVARAEKLIDDSEENIRATMAAGKSTFRYGEVPELKGPAEEKFGQSNIEGGMLEAALSQLLGYNINVDTLERNRAIDFPQGLGRGAQLFGLPPNIETEVKRTLDGVSFSKAREEFSRYFKENPQAFAIGGKIRKLAKGGYSRRIESLVPFEEGVGPSPFAQPSISKLDYYSILEKSGLNLQSWMIDNLSDRARTNLWTQEQTLMEAKRLQTSAAQNLTSKMDKQSLLRGLGAKFALGGLADSTEAMSGLMQGLYGNRSQQTDKKEKDFGKISITEDGNMLSVGYLKNESRSGYVQAMKYKDNLWYVGLSKATKGYGPRLYDVAMEAVSEKGGMLTSDRSMVSSDAQKVWAYYFKNRGDVKKTPLEPENWTKNQSLIDPKLYGRRETWPPPTDPAWILQSGYSKSPTLLNDPEQVKRNNNRTQKPVDSRSMALAYFQRADGGPISRFADGGSVPALVSNGEAYVPPKLAKRIGYGTLGRMNQADKNGMGRFSDGGISVFKGPGSGTSDSIPTSLPVGSFIIREKATKALGLNKGGSVGIQKFQDGGAPTNNGDLYFTTLSAAQIQDIVGKGSSRTGIDVESLDLLTRYAQDAGMSIEDFSSGLIRARDTAVVSALMQGQSFKEAALAGQQAAIAMADIPNMQVTGENPLDVLRSLTASSTRVQANVEQRREILSDPEIIAAINETNDLMSKLTPAEQFSVQTGTGSMTPEMEAAAASRRRQKNIVGYKIEERQTQANQPGFVAPTIQQPTNLMDIDGINNQLKEAQNNAALYASSLRDQANAIRAQQEITIDPGTFAGLEAKAQALEEKAAATEKAYQDLADSTQESVSWFDTEYQAAIDSMRIRAESVAKATQDVEKAMVTRAKEIASANPELTAEEIGQQISTEKTGIVAEARAQQTEAETKFGMAQSRVDTLAGKAGAGADILSQEKAAADKARAEAQAKAEADAQLEARKQQARDLGAKRAAIAVPSQREGETEQEFKDRRQKATERFTRQSAQELGLSKTRFVSSRQKKAIEEEEAKKTKVEREKTDVAVQSTDTKATLLLVQAINANTVAQTGSADSVKSLTEQTNGLIATNEQLTNAKNADIEQANASPDDSDLFKDTLREIPFLDKLETLGSAVGDFANNFAASTTDVDGKISKFGSVLQGGASRLESGIKKLASGIRSANEAFLNTKIGKFADSFSQYGTAIGFGVTSVSQYLADMSGGFETTSGTLLQFGATIASQATIIGTFGAQFGPLGGLIGSVAGAAMGLTRAFFDMQNAARERARAELELSKDNAFESATSSFELAIAGSASSVDDFKAGLSDMVTVINAEKQLLQQSEEASLFTRDYMGFGGLREKTGSERTKAIQTQAASQQQGAALAKQFMGGLMSRGNMTLEQVRGQVGEENYKAMGAQIAQADAIYIDITSKAAAERRKGTISEQEYKNKVDEAREASVKRALATQQAAAAEEEYRTSVTEARKRLESSGTAFLKELITSTPKQRTEMRKNFESAGGLLEGDFTKSRAQQEEAAQKAFRETSGTVKEKREAADTARAQVRESNFQRAEQILSFGDQSSNEIRNARANLYETQLREQGINPNEGMAKMVIDSLRAPDPEVQARERNVKAILDNTDALEALTQGIGKEDIYADPLAQATNNENIGRSGRETVATYGVGAAVAAGGIALGSRIPGVRRGVRGMFASDQQVASAADNNTPKSRTVRIDPNTGQTVGGPTKPSTASTPKPKTTGSSTTKSRGSGRGSRASRRGLFGLASTVGTAAVATGAGFLMGGGAETAPESAIESSPEIIQLLSAIEANTRECCMAGGERVMTNTGRMETGLSEKIGDNTTAQAREENFQKALAILNSGDNSNPQIRDAKANLYEARFREQGIDPSQGMAKLVIENIRKTVPTNQETLAGSQAAVVSEQLQTKAIDTNSVQEAIDTISSSTDPAVVAMANIAARSDILAQQFDNLSNATAIMATTTSEAGTETETAATETRSAALDWIQAGLDIAGLVPLFGEIADGANAAIYGLRAAASNDPGVQKDLMVDAGLSAAAMIPVAGYAANAVKGSKYAAKATGMLGKTGTRVVSGLANEAADYGIMSASEGVITSSVDSVMGAGETSPMVAAQTESEAQTAEASLITSAVQSIGTTIWDSGAWLTTALQTGFAALPGMLSTLFNSIIPSIASALWSGLKTVSVAIYEGGIAAVGSLWSGITALPGVIYELGLSALSSLWESTKVLGSVIADVGMMALSGLWEGVKALPGFIYETGMSALGMLWSGISSLPGLIIDGIMAIFTFEANVGAFIGEQVYNIGKMIWDSSAAGIQYIQDLWPRIPDILYQAFLDGTLFILDGLVAVGEWVQGQFTRVMDNIINGINDVAYGIISKIPVYGESIVKTLGLTNPAERAKKEQASREIEKPSKIQTRKTETETTAATKQTSQPVAAQFTPTQSLAPQGTMAVQATSKALQQQQAVPVPETITGQGGQVIPVVGDAGSNAAITRGSSFMAQVEAMDAANRTTEQPSVVSASAIDAAMATQSQPAPAETDNWFKNAQADLTRIQASPDANITGNTQPANGVINTSTTQQQPTAAGMSQLFDTAAIGNTLQTVFGQFVSDLQNIQLPKIPDLVTMEGKHTVEVIINGADVLKSLEPMLQDLIKTKLTEFNNKLNSTTEGGFGA